MSHSDGPIQEPAHSQGEHRSAISRLWGWTISGGNFGIGLLQTAVGGASSMSLLGDAVHNFGDAWAYKIQADNELGKHAHADPHIAAERLAHRRRWSHMIIAAGSLAVAAKAGVDLGFNLEPEPQPLSVWAAGLSLGFNALMGARLYQGIRARMAATGDQHMTHTERDLVQHIAKVDMPSAVIAVAGTTLHRYNVDLEQAAGLASGLYGAWTFRPTAANLQGEHCAGHAH
jgi:hypothetical protein